jgi:hypothetical protein
MTFMTKILAGGAGIAALAAAAPAAAQYYPYGYSQQGYGNNPYAYNNYGYANTNFAAQRCTAAVQNRLYTRTGLAGILGSLVGAYGTQPRVLSITRVNPNRSYVRVRGLATSGRMAYNPYGVGYYGALGANYAADLSFRCDVDYRGYVRDIDINRR